MTSDSAEESHINTGAIIDGKYRIVRLLGEGGMGAVYEGENLRIRRKVAIKVLHPSVSTQTDVVKRFEREAQAAALVGSEHICEVLDLGVLSENAHYMVMEYLDGETLSGRIARHGRLSPAQTIPLVLQVLEALAAAHNAGIIHRDLKPDNIFILPQRGGIRDFVKILDFGVSKFNLLSADEMNVTRAGAVVGTPYYMSPEQARGVSAVDARTDIYAIGVLLYQATTGQVPYEAETFNELLFKIALEVAPPPQTYVPDLDPEFAGIIMKAMTRDPAQRFQSCNEFRDVLLAYSSARASYGQFTPAPGRPSMPSFSPPASGNAWDSTPGTAPPNSTPGWAAVAPTMNAATPSTLMPEATSNAWGHASGSVTLPKSKAPVVLGILAAVAVLGGAAVAAIVLLGKPSARTPEQAGSTPTATVSVTASVAPTAVATVAPTATEVTPTMATASPATTETPTAATAAPVVAKPPVGTKPGRPGGNKLPPTPTTKPSAVKPPPKPGNDLGY